MFSPAHRIRLRPDRIHDEEKGYYADGEDAYDMRKQLKQRNVSAQLANMSLEETASSAQEQEEEQAEVLPVVPRKKGDVAGEDKANVAAAEAGGNDAAK